jgi:TetR/AcrR family transcriptional repressor of nem operon
MSAAELTAGGFYAHFASKEALFAATMRSTLAGTAQSWRETLAEVEEGARVDAFIDRYLSPLHRDSMETGCALASLACDAARAGDETKRAVDDEWGGFLARIESSLRGGHRAERAIAIFALCAGGVLLARAVADAAFSDRILKACKRAARELASATK